MSITAVGCLTTSLSTPHACFSEEATNFGLQYRGSRIRQLSESLSFHTKPVTLCSTNVHNKRWARNWNRPAGCLKPLFLLSYSWHWQHDETVKSGARLGKSKQRSFEREGNIPLFDLHYQLQVIVTFIKRHRCAVASERRNQILANPWVSPDIKLDCQQRLQYLPNFCIPLLGKNIIIAAGRYGIF